MLEFLEVAGGNYRIGTTPAGVEKSLARWRLSRSSEYPESTIRDWIEKECPDHYVTVKRFELSRTPVRNADIAKYLEETGALVPESYAGPKDHPCWGVSLEWATQYAKWLSRQADFIYRLPTETEWEVAARGSDFRDFPYGADFDPSKANTHEGKIGAPSSVEAFSQYPGPFGHVDLAGNVEEWVSTPYYVYPGGRVIKDNLYETLGEKYPVLRGGSFVCGADLSRSARRHGPFTDPELRYTGFRLVRERRAF